MKKLLIVMAALDSLSCKDSTGPKVHVGVYTLRTINGQNPPQVVAQNSSGILEFTAGVVSLNADGTFSDRTDFRFTSGSTVTTDFVLVVGTYQRDGDNVTFFASGGGSYSMAYAGTSLTQVEEGITLVYRR